MGNLITNLLYERIEQILAELRKNNREYETLVERDSELGQIVDRITQSKEEIIVSTSDAQAINEYINCFVMQNSIAYNSLYVQGYTDCVKLFKMIEII